MNSGIVTFRIIPITTGLLILLIIAMSSNAIAYGVLTNPGFETGDETGWSYQVGAYHGVIANDSLQGDYLQKTVFTQAGTDYVYQTGFETSGVTTIGYDIKVFVEGMTAAQAASSHYDDYYYVRNQIFLSDNNSFEQNSHANQPTSGEYLYHNQKVHRESTIVNSPTGYHRLSFKYTTNSIGPYWFTVYLDNITINGESLTQVPIADFSATPRSGNFPLSVQFNDTSINGPTSWAWDFNNDGTTDSTVQNATYTFNNVDDYTVTLTATNSAGSDSETKIDLISVSQPPPIFGEGTGGAGTTTTTTGNAPFPVTFQANATGDNLALSWDFGDGTTSTEATPTHTYTTPGTYTVTVTITNLGGTITDTFTITVPGFVHSANITGAIGSTAGLHARFNDTSTMDVVNDTTTELTSFSMGRLIYDATKPLSLYGVGDWWIIILLGVIAAIIILGQNNSPFLTILLLMIGNLALWGLASKHFDMLGTVTTLALFSLAMIGISVYKGSKSRG